MFANRANQSTAATMTRKINATPVTPRWPAPQWLACGPLHRMAWRDVGAPAGEPWLLLHGGPGSGCQPGMLAPFDLRRQRVIAPDQRGAGASLPHGRVAGNHLAALVADLEALRRHLGLARWSLLGGSWGTVVALQYACTHPDRVQRLVLRGAFGLTRREIGGLLLPGVRHGKALAAPGRAWPVRAHSPLPAALSHLEQLLQNDAASVTALYALRGWALREMRDALHGMRRSLRHSSGAQAAAQRRAWAALQRQQRRALAQLLRPQAGKGDARLWARYRVQVHYLRRGGFVRPGEQDGAVRQLARQGLAVDWVHGRLDDICPPANSAHWARMQQRLASGSARLHRPVSGHLGHEPAMAACLRGCVGRSVQDCQKT